MLPRTRTITRTGWGIAGSENKMAKLETRATIAMTARLKDGIGAMRVRTRTSLDGVIQRTRIVRSMKRENTDLTIEVTQSGDGMREKSEIDR